MIGELMELAELRTLVQAAARSRFTTLRATVRDWSSYRRISELQGLGWSGHSEEAGERFTRVWIDADRHVREELDTGEVRNAADLNEASHEPLFDPSWLAEEPQILIIGSREVAGRAGIAIEVPNPASGLDLLPGADRCVCVVDPARGVLLRCEAWLGDELLMVEELINVAFDEPLDPRLFVPN